MNDHSFDSGDGSELRKRAEQLVNESQDEGAFHSLSDVKSLVRELVAYQRKLEQRNVEIGRTRSELERQVRERREAERSRDENLAHFERIAQHVPDCFWSMRIGEDGQRTVEYVSPGWESIRGDVPQNSAHDANLWMNAAFTDDLPLVQDAFARAVSTGTRQTATYRIHWKHGDKRWVEDTMTPVADESGRVVRIEGIARDVTQRVVATEHLKLTHHAMASTEHGIVVTDPNQPDNPIIYCNPEFQRMTGYAEHEILGRNCRFLQNDDRDQSALEPLREAIHRRQGCRVVLRNYRQNGEMFWNELLLSPVFNESGELSNFVGEQTDVTARKHSELFLAGQNRALDLIAHGASPDDVAQVLIRAVEQVNPSAIAAVLLVDRNGCLRNFGQNRLPEHFNAAFDGLSIEPEKTSCAACVFRGERVIVEDILTHPDWEHYREEATQAGLRACWSEPIVSSTGKTLGLLALYFPSIRAPEDLDLQRLHTLAHLVGIAIERRRIEDSLRTTQFSVDRSADGIIWSNIEARITYVNSSAGRMTGYACEELLTMSIFDIDPVFSRSEWKDLWRQVNSDVQLVTESVVRRKDGSEFPVELSLTTMSYEADEILVAFVRDISQRKAAQQELADREQQLRLVTDAMPALIAYVDSDLRYQFNNAAYEKWMGRSPAELKGQHVRQVIGDEFEKLRPYFERALQGETVVFEPRLPFKDKKLHQTRVSLVPNRQPDGTTAGFFALVIDQTGLVEAERALRKSEAKWRSLITNAPGFICLVNRDRKFEFVNRYTPEFDESQVIGESCFSLTHEDSLEPLREALSAVFDHQESAACELQDVTGRWYASYLGPVLSDGEVTAAMIVSLDITERRTAQEKQQQQSDLLEETQQMAQLGYWQWDLQSNQLTWSSELYRIYGLDPLHDEITFERFLAALHPDDRDTVQQNCQRTLKTGTPFIQDERIHRPDGSERILLSRGYRVCDDQDQPIALRGTCLDVTELRNEEMRFRGLLEAAPDAMVIVDETGSLTLVNGQTERLFGYDRQEMLGQPVEMLVPEDFRSRHVELRNQFFQQPSSRPMGRELELNGIRKDGSEFPVEISLSPVQTPRGLLVTAAVRDVTLQKQAIELLRKSEQRLAEAQRIGHIGSWEWDITTNTTTWSDELYRLFDPDPEHFTPSMEAFVERVAPEDRQAVEDAIQATLDRNEPFKVEYRISRDDGVRFHACIAEVVRDDTGQPLRFSGTVEDVTVRRNLETSLRRTERLASLGTLAAGIAHEINNPMSAAWTAAETAKSVIDQPDKADIVEESLDAIGSAVQRCRVIIENVLRFSRRGSSQKTLADLNAVVRDAVETTAHFVQQHDSILNAEYARDLPQVLLNAVEIEQVLVNLIRNAVQSGKGTEVSVSSGRVSDEVFVRIRDNGRGIPSEYLERVFDPFFTQFDSSDGTGLGLAISHGIVADHDGSIDIESQVGQGSTFTMRLPIGSL